MAKRKRIIDVLREKFPDLTWRYEWPAWKNSAGWEICAYARFAPRHEFDDEHYETEYRRSDTHEVMYGLTYGLPLW